MSVENLMLAAISGETLLHVVVWLIVAALIYWILTWAVSKIPIAEPFRTIINVLIVLAAAFFCINALLSLTGHPLVKW
jgi:hypothetical protein